MMIHIKQKVLLIKVTNHNLNSFYIPHNWTWSLTKAPKFKNSWKSIIYKKATDEEIKKYKDNEFIKNIF